MLKLKYRSKEFLPACNKALDDMVDFEVDFKTRLWKKSVRNYIDSLFHGSRFRVNPLVMIFCLDLMSCISNAFNSKKYRVEYLESKGGILILFHSLDQ